MKFWTPRTKVYTYRAIGGVLWILVIVFITIGIGFAPVHRLLFLFSAGIFFLTAFASSQSKFAKEVTMILSYCAERKCMLDEFPSTVSQREMLRLDDGEGSIFLELIEAVTGVITARGDVDRFWREKNKPAERIANVQLHNATGNLFRKWEIYRHAGVLPFMDPIKRTEWKDLSEFQERIALGTLLIAREKHATIYA